MGMNLLVSGKVQGVGFRYAAKQCADYYHLTGWVQNQDDGTVELEIQGTDEDVDQFINKMREGFNRFIRVDDIQINNRHVEKSYSSFQIQ